MLKRFCSVPLLCLAGLLHAQPGTPPPSPKVYPMQVELVASTSAAKLKVGDSILAKLKQQWTYSGCNLSRGAAVIGRVTALSLPSKAAKGTSVSLLFDAPCAGAAVQQLVWIALLAPDNSNLAGLHDGNPVSVQAFRSTSFGEGGGVGRSGIEDRTDLSGRQSPNLPAFLGPAPDRSHPRPTSVFTGQVWGIPDVKLSVGSGPLGSSTVSTSKKELRIATGSVLVLSPLEAATVAVNVPAPTAPRAVSNVPLVDSAALSKETCEPSTCSVVPHGGPLPASTEQAAQTIPLGSLSYRHLKAAEMLEFEYGAALAYLGPEHLLFTFNPHTLVPRVGEADPADHPHMVRAVLFNLKTSSVEATYDWRVGDDRQYLWPIAEDRVLVHSGDRLRLLALRPALAASSTAASGLEEIVSVPLASRLAFVRSAPDRRHIAVGVVRELHTPEVHKKMTEANSNGAEEEVSVQLLDGELKPVGGSRQSSYALAPVVSNDGRITLLHAGGERWRYQETSWIGSTRTFARVRSACIPEMSTLSSSLFFVTGCDVKAADRWYRVLRADGTTVLKGDLLSQDLEPLPIADIAGDAVAVALPSARVGYMPHSTFHGADLSSEVVRVFRSSDGRDVFTARVHASAPTKQPIAFAPGGAQIAMLDGEEIVIYALHPQPPRDHAVRAAGTSASP